MCYERPLRRQRADELSSEELWEAFEREPGHVAERPKEVSSEPRGAEPKRMVETERAGAET